MNNRINAIKRRADTLADYIVDRCARLEKENGYMKHEAEIVRRELRGYEDAFYEILKKMEGIEELGDGSIIIKFIAEDGAKMSQIIPVTGFLHPIAKMLLKKNDIWRVKR